MDIIEVGNVVTKLMRSMDNEDRYVVVVSERRNQSFSALREISITLMNIHTSSVVCGCKRTYSSGKEEKSKVMKETESEFLFIVMQWLLKGGYGSL